MSLPPRKKIPAEFLATKYLSPSLSLVDVETINKILPEPSMKSMTVDFPIGGRGQEINMDIIK